ncbi:MAG: hypothetical protein SPK80_09860 [Bacteroidales bacterium]|nr:hypothetical protein [Bacteroidales bacterium]
MFKVSDPISTPPETFASVLQQTVYDSFRSLSIPFERVDTDPGLTMEDCQHIDAKIGVRIVKTVFLCNRQHGVHTIEHAEALGLGSRKYTLVSMDK